MVLTKKKSLALTVLAVAFSLSLFSVKLIIFNFEVSSSSGAQELETDMVDSEVNNDIKLDGVSIRAQSGSGNAAAVGVIDCGKGQENAGLKIKGGEIVAESESGSALSSGVIKCEEND